MILELFLPEFIQQRRILSKQIVGLAYEDGTLTLSLIHASRSKTVIEHIDSASVSSKSDCGSVARSLLEKVPAYDYLRISIPSSIVFFKELTLPFKSAQKIRAIIGYEAEPLLPFPLKDAIIDFIFTHQDPLEEESRVLVIAIRKQDLEAELAPYKAENIYPTHVTVDIMALYDLCSLMPAYENIPGQVALIDCTKNTTKIAFIENGSIRLVRTIPKGYTVIEGHQLPQKQENYTKKNIPDVFVNFLNEIQFTLNAFSFKAGSQESISKVIFASTYQDAASFISFASHTLQIPWEHFNATQLLENKSIKLKNTQLRAQLDDASHALATSFVIPAHADFNLKPEDDSVEGNTLLQRQVRAGLILTATILAGTCLYGYIQISGLARYKHQLEEREIERIKTTLKQAKSLEKKDATLSSIQRILKLDAFLTLLNKTKALVLEEEENWETLRTLPLQTTYALYELTRLVEETGYKVTISSISMESNDDKDHASRIELSGIFTSQQLGQDFQEFAKFEQKIQEIPTPLKLITPSETGLGEHGGVKFTFHLKLKSYVGHEKN